MSQQTGSVIAACVNLIFPPFGQLVQGRIMAFLTWLAIFVTVGIVIGVLAFVTGGLGAILGFIAAPVLYFLVILDAALYKG